MDKDDNRNQILKEVVAYTTPCISCLKSHINKKLWLHDRLVRNIFGLYDAQNCMKCSFLVKYIEIV